MGQISIGFVVDGGKPLLGLSSLSRGEYFPGSLLSPGFGQQPSGFGQQYPPGFGQQSPCFGQQPLVFGQQTLLVFFQNFFPRFGQQPPFGTFPRPSTKPTYVSTT
jgi:hypothetical protein